MRWPRRVRVSDVQRVIAEIEHDIGRGGPLQPMVDTALETIAARLALLIHRTAVKENT